MVSPGSHNYVSTYIAIVSIITLLATGLNGTVAKPLANRLVNTGFMSHYQLQPRDVFLKEEGNILFNDVLNTFYLRLYGVWVFQKPNG